LGGGAPEITAKAPTRLPTSPPEVAIPCTSATRAKAEIRSATTLVHHIEQVMNTYEKAFPYIYIAVANVREDIKEMIKQYLTELGYGFIIVNMEREKG